MDWSVITIFIGDTGDYLHQQAKQLDEKAQLLQHTQLLVPGVYFTSLGEFDRLQDFIQILQQADILVYRPPSKWSDQKNNASDMRQWTEFYLMALSQIKTVEGLIPNRIVKDSVLQLVEQRQSSKSQLWIAGCSISHGFAIPKDLRYGQVLANKLQLPVSFLTLPGSGIEWASDQIIRSDIRNNDIVVFGVTNANRFSYFDGQRLQHVTSQYYQKNTDFVSIMPLDRLDDADRVHKCVTAVHRVVSYCRKMHVKLILAGILLGENYLQDFYDIPEWLQLYGFHGFGPSQDEKFLDLGDDGWHPGINQHAWYAEQILSKIRKFNTI